MYICIQYICIQLTYANVHTGALVEARDLQMISLRAACRECCPSLYRQLRPCVAPDNPRCGRHNGTPRLRPVAMRTVLLSILSPAEDCGNAFNHAPALGVDVARRRAHVYVAVSGIGCVTGYQVIRYSQKPIRSNSNLALLGKID